MESRVQTWSLDLKSGLGVWTGSQDWESGLGVWTGSLDWESRVWTWSPESALGIWSLDLESRV